MSTRRGVVDESKRTLEESVEPERASTLTMSHRRVEAESGESDRSDTSDTDWRCRGRVPEARTTSTKALESIEADRARWQATHISRGATYRFRKPLERSATRTTDSLLLFSRDLSSWGILVRKHAPTSALHIFSTHTWNSPEKVPIDLDDPGEHSTG
jgi:hypothetical protein